MVSGADIFRKVFCVGGDHTCVMKSSDSLSIVADRFPHVDPKAITLVLEKFNFDVDKTIAFIDDIDQRQKSNSRIVVSKQSSVAEPTNGTKEMGALQSSSNVVYRVLYNFKPSDGCRQQQLSLTRGQLVVTQPLSSSIASSTSATTATTTADALRRAGAIDNGWSYGRIDECYGYFPLAYVRPRSSDVVAVALADFPSSSNNANRSHLPFRRGERLTLLSRITGYDWWYACDANGAVGRVPINLLEPVINVDEYRARSVQTQPPEPVFHTSSSSSTTILNAPSSSSSSSTSTSASTATTDVVTTSRNSSSKPHETTTTTTTPSIATHSSSTTASTSTTQTLPTSMSTNPSDTDNNNTARSRSNNISDTDVSDLDTMPDFTLKDFVMAETEAKRSSTSDRRMIEALRHLNVVLQGVVRTESATNTATTSTTTNSNSNNGSTCIDEVDDVLKSIRLDEKTANVALTRLERLSRTTTTTSITNS